MFTASGLKPLGVFFACLVLCAQVPVPRIGTVDFYGISKRGQTRLKQVLHIAEGDRLPASKAEIEERLQQIPGIVAAHVEAVCCQGGLVNLFIGVAERGAPNFTFRTPPTGEAVLPRQITNAHRQYLEAVEKAARRRTAQETIVEGHPLMADPEVRPLQEQFLRIAADHLEDLRKVLRESADPEQRAIAAGLIGYRERKREIVNDLQAALQDPDPLVRANALRALTAIAALGARRPDLEIQVAPTWIVEMLNSVALSDRLGAVEALVTLTENRPENTLSLLRERALQSVIEMARWNSLRHALPSFLLVGRLAGLPEDQIQAAWTKGERERVIEAAQRSRGRKSEGKGARHGSVAL